MIDSNYIIRKIVSREIPTKIVFENYFNLAFLDISPISRGHSVIISKNHYPTLEEIPDSELTANFLVVKKIATIIHENLLIDVYNIQQNNFAAAVQVINHFHVHIIPRNFNDQKFPINIPKNQANEEELIKVLKLLMN